MSIASEIARLSKNVSDSLDAVAAKGVTVPSGSNSDDLPGLIAQITGGGGGGGLIYQDVNGYIVLDPEGNGGAITITDTEDPAGGIIRTITASEVYIDGDNLAYGGADSAVVGIGVVGQMQL